MGTKWPNWVRNYQIEIKSGYEMTKMVRNDLSTKWPGYEMTGYLNIVNSDDLACSEATDVVCQIDHEDTNKSVKMPSVTVY